MILQHAYRPILNFIYDKITFRLNDRTRKILLFVCFFAIFAAQFAAQYIFKFQGFNRGIRDYFICLMMGIIILVSVDRKLEIVKWNLWTYVPFTVTGILLLIASLDHDMGPAYQAFPLAMLVAFMCLFYVWGNRKDYEVLFDAAAGAYTVFAGILLLVCFVKYPIQYYNISLYGIWYSPFGINPNGVAKIFLAGIVSSLYFLTVSRRKWLIIVNSLFIGGAISVIHYTSCRTADLCLSGLVVVLILFFIMRWRIGIQQITAGYFFKKGVVIGICVVLGCFLSCIILNSVSDKIYEWTVKSVEQSQQVVTEEQSNGKEVSEREQIINKQISYAEQELYKNDNMHQGDIFMGGRLSIWYVYFHNMTWRGSSELMFYDTEYAHNQYIELSYKAGIPTGIVYLIFNLIAGILAVRMFFKRKDSVGLLALSVFVVFFIISMLDTGVLPFERGFIFLYYITLTPLFFRREKQKKITKA